MAVELIATYRKPEFPKLAVSENTFRTIIEYIGPAADIEPNIPERGDAWGDFQGTVISTDYNLTGNTSIAELTVIVQLLAEVAEETAGTLESISYEIDWDIVTRSLYEHPQFAIKSGGSNELTSEDVVDIELWKAEENKTLKSAYQYVDSELTLYELTTNAKLFARGVELSQENWEDYAPIARKTSVYRGGPPDQSEAGAKDEPAGFFNLPDGYEWRKSADRTLNSGSRTRFDRTEEWLGAVKILTDKNQVYWDAP